MFSSLIEPQQYKTPKIYTPTFFVNGCRRKETQRKCSQVTALLTHILANRIKRNDVDMACMKQGRGHVYTDLVRKPEGNKLLGKPRRGWNDIKMVFIEIRQMGVN